MAELVTGDVRTFLVILANFDQIFTIFDVHAQLPTSRRYLSANIVPNFLEAKPELPFIKCCIFNLR